MASVSFRGTLSLLDKGPQPSTSVEQTQLIRSLCTILLYTAQHFHTDFLIFFLFPELCTSLRSPVSIVLVSDDHGLSPFLTYP